MTTKARAKGADIEMKLLVGETAQTSQVDALNYIAHSVRIYSFQRSRHI